MIIYFISAVMVGGIVYQLGKYVTLLAIIAGIGKYAVIGLTIIALVFLMRRLLHARSQKLSLNAQI